MDNLTLLTLLKNLKEKVESVEKLQGPTGPMGPQGPQGERGADGIQGLRGPAGERGSDGTEGPVGPAGLDGKDGVGVESVSEAADGTLVFNMTDGTTHVVELPESLYRASEGGSTTTVVQQNVKQKGHAVYVQDNQPYDDQPHLWLQTNVNDDGDFTLWFAPNC